jgi:hypothetical protein
MTIQGEIEEWESWTGLSFPQSGDYIIPGGGSPLTVSRESNTGTYYDANVWVAYHFELVGKDAPHGDYARLGLF